MELSFCRRCGQPLHHRQDNVYRCPQDHTIYLNPAPTVGIFFVTPDNKVMLARRGIEPHRGMLDAFGGFVNPHETFEQVAIRELREELSLEPHEYESLRYFTSAYADYEEETESTPLLGAFFWSRLLTERPLKASDDVEALVTIPLQDVDLTKLHDEDIRHAIVALQREILGEL